MRRRLRDHRALAPVAAGGVHALAAEALEAGATREEILAVIEAQVSPGTRLAAADDVIENSGGLDKLATRVNQLHEKYLEIAIGQSGS